jgi:hypothetical protein
MPAQHGKQIGEGESSQEDRIPVNKFNGKRIIFSDTGIKPEMIINKYKDRSKNRYRSKNSFISFGEIATYVLDNTFHLKGKVKYFNGL